MKLPPTQSNNMTPIYLDNNSTTRIDTRVAKTMYDCYREGLVNPASQHRMGNKARRRLEQAREDVGRILGCRTDCLQPDRAIFTSGGTEANNLAILGLVSRPPGRIIISSIEHPSVMGPAERLSELGFDVQRAHVYSTGIVDVQHVHDLLTEDTQLVSVMLANSETGVLQPVAEIAELCSAAGVPLHTDAVQVAGKLPVDFSSLGAAAMTVAAHKLHGPPGIGALLLRPEFPLQPILFGGFQQGGQRPGTENVALAMGFVEALRSWFDEAERRRDRMTHLRDRFESGLRRTISELVVNGDAGSRLPQTSNLAFPGVERQTLLIALDMAGVCCSTGTACASGSSEPSPVLQAMRLDDRLIDSSLRFSLGADTTVAEVDRAIDLISKAVNELRTRKSGGKEPAPPRI